MSTSCHRLRLLSLATCHLPLATWPAALTVCNGKSISSANLYYSNEIPMSLLHLPQFPTPLFSFPLPSPALGPMANDDEYEQQPGPRVKRNEQKGRQRKERKKEQITLFSEKKKEQEEEKEEQEKEEKCTLSGLFATAASYPPIEAGNQG